MQSTSGGYRSMDRLTTIVSGIRDGTYKLEDYFKSENKGYDWQRAQDWVDLEREEFYIKYPDSKSK